MPEEKKPGIRIPTNMILPIISFLVVIGGWVSTYAVLSYKVDSLKENFELHEKESDQKIAILEAERGSLLNKLHEIELVVKGNQTILEEMRR